MKSIRKKRSFFEKETRHHPFHHWRFLLIGFFFLIAASIIFHVIFFLRITSEDTTAIDATSGHELNINQQQLRTIIEFLDQRNQQHVEESVS